MNYGRKGNSQLCNIQTGVMHKSSKHKVRHKSIITTALHIVHYSFSNESNELRRDQRFIVVIHENSLLFVQAVHSSYLSQQDRPNNYLGLCLDPSPTRVRNPVLSPMLKR